MPPTIIANASAWYGCGNSPRKAEDRMAVNKGVRLVKKAPMRGRRGAPRRPSSETR